MNKTKRNSLYLYISVTFLIAFLPRFILCFFSYPANFPGDEVTAAASAATAYGMDWSNVLSIGRYYGQGFTIIFTPFYYVTHNPIIIFRIMNVVFSLLQALGSLIAFHCLYKYLKITNYLYLSICAIGCSYLLESRATIISNEHPLLLICWLITWILLILNSCDDNNKKRAKYTIILVVILVYSLTLHTRAITLWLALVVCVVIYFWVYRKWIISLPVFAALGISGGIFGTIVITYIQKTVWSKTESNALANTSFNINLDNIKSLLKPDSWQGWLNIIIGQLNTVYIITCGFALIGAAILGTLIWQALKRKSEILISADSKLLSHFILIGSFFGFAVIITICGQSISWLPGVRDGMLKGFGSKVYGFKAFTYFRYFGLYTGPLLMLTFAYIYLYKDKLIRYLKSTTIIMIILQVYFTICIIPYIYNFQEYVTTLFRPFVFFLTDNKTNIYTFIGSSLTVFVLWIVIWICFRKKKVIIPVLIVSCFLIYQYVSLTIHYDYVIQNKRYNMVNSSYELMTRIQANPDIPKEIYVIPRDGSTSTAPYFTYQFYLNQFTISPWLPDANLSEAIAFYHKPDYEYLINLGYHCIELDSNEFIYIKGEHLESIIRSSINNN